jgi:hypothetical protein
LDPPERANGEEQGQRGHGQAWGEQCSELGRYARVFDTAAQSTESGVQADSSVARLVTAAFVAVELAFRTSALVDVGQY